MDIKNIIIISLIAAMFLMSGCALSDYITGKVPVDGNLSTSESNSDNISGETNGDVSSIDDTISEIAGNETQGTTSTPGEAVDDSKFLKLSVKENQMVRLKPKAKDPNNDQITYKFSEPLNAQGEWQTNYGDAGNYLITVSASDGKLTTTKKVLLTVQRVNVPPVIEGLSDTIDVNEGDTLKITPKVTDPNKDKVTVVISNPVGNTGVWKIGYKDHGVYNLTITASDGELKTVKPVKIVVKRKNMPPQIELIKDITVNEGDLVNITSLVKVTDINGDKLTITVSDPIGNDGVWQTDYASRGKYPIVITATDGELTTKQSFILTVLPVNKAPEILDIALS